MGTILNTLKDARAWLLLALALGLGLEFGLVASSHAGSLSVSPVLVQLSTSTSTARLDVENQSDKPIVVQAEALLWRQTAEGEEHAASDQLVFNPPLFSLAPGQRQIVRVGMRQRAAPATEGTYRLYLTEVSKPNPDMNGLKVNMRLGIPVFVQATATGQPHVSWTLERGPGNSLDLTSVNNGQLHGRLTDIRVIDTASNRTVGHVASSWTLPGGVNRWRFENTASDGRYLILADLDGQPTSTPIRLDRN